ncbi:MAG TPA: hypothetical protein G4O03_06825 [Dehalococcoidia bacterium]|nr:hypothetical protein [Dehalococcoidia bacterium]
MGLFPTDAVPPIKALAAGAAIGGDIIVFPLLPGLDQPFAIRAIEFLGDQSHRRLKDLISGDDL